MINGKVKQVSDFQASTNWLFVFEDAEGLDYIVMTSDFYKLKGLKSQITKRDLDSLDVDMNVSFDFALIDNIRIVTKFSW